MKMIDFIRRFVEKGGDVAKLSYTIDRVGDEAIRSVISFEDDKLTVRKPDGLPYTAIRSFLFFNEYRVTVESVLTRGGLRNKDYRPVLLTLLPND